MTQWCSQHVALLFHLQLSGATIFPLCVCGCHASFGEEQIAFERSLVIGFWSFLPFQIFFFFVSFVLDDVDRLSVKHCPNEGLTSQWDTTFSSTSFNYHSIISRFQAKNTLICTNSTRLELDKISVSWLFLNSFLRETAHLGTLAWWKGCQVPWLQLHCAPALRVWHQGFYCFLPTLRVWATWKSGKQWKV